MHQIVDSATNDEPLGGAKQCIQYLSLSRYDNIYHLRFYLWLYLDMAYLVLMQPLKPGKHNHFKTYQRVLFALIFSFTLFY